MEPSESNQIDCFKENISQLRLFFEHSYDGFWICCRDGNVLEVNPAGAALIDSKREDLLGKNVRDLLLDGIYDKSAILKALEVGHAVTLLINCRNGKQALATANPIYIEGQIRYVILNARDITGLQKLKEELEETKAITERYRIEYSILKSLEDLKDKIIFRSSKMEAIMNLIARAAPTDATILITGESGTGKGLISEAIHCFSKRKDHPIFSINCGMLPPNLIESELFGYDAGAFTGAHIKGKMGLVEMADGGTLFLDEIGDIESSLQVKLLNFLETKTFTKIGGTKKKQIDTRIIGATNRDLGEEVATGRFRNDLYYRLNAIPIHIPPLRERREDIPPLISFYMTKYTEKYSKNITLTADTFKSLLSLGYPGNVRELKHLIERIVILSEKNVVDLASLKAIDYEESCKSNFSFQVPQGLSLIKAKKKLEEEMIQKTLEFSTDQKDAARILGVNQSTISRKMKKIQSH